MIRARLENFLYVPLPDCPQLAYTLAELAARRNGVSAETLKARLTLPLRDEKGVVVGSFGAYDDTREGWLGIPWFCPEADAARDRYGVDDFTERGEKLDVGLSTPFVFRDGQEELVHAALAELVGGEHPPRSVIACAPPGMGKTVVAVALAHRLGRAFCVIVNTTEIMRRWEEEILKRFGVLPTIIGGGHGLLEEGRCPAIGVAMVQTLTTKASKLPTAYWVEYFRRYGTMIADECLDPSTRVAVPSGWSAIGDLRPGDFIVAPDGKSVRVTMVSRTTKPAVRISLRCGTSLVLSEDHPVLTVIDRGGLRGTYVRPVGEAENLVFWDGGMASIPEIDPATYFLGIFLGDGCWSAHTLDKIRLAFGSKADRLRPVLDGLCASLGVSPVVKKNKRGDTTWTFSREWSRAFAERWGLTRGPKAQRIRLPEELVARADLGVVKGLLDTDASFYSDSMVYQSASSVICWQLKSVLARYGIRATVRGYPRVSNHAPYFRTTATGVHYKRLIALLGHGAKAKHSLRLPTSKTLRNGLTSDSIVNVESVGVRELVDISLDSAERLFVAEGYIVHNCDTLPTQVFSQSIPMFHARYRIAVTATLQRRDGLTKLIHWHFGKAVEATDKREPPRAVQVTLPETVRDQAFTFRGELNRNYGISLLAKHRNRNAWVLDLAKKIYAKDRRVMVLGERIEQLAWLEQQLVGDYRVLRLYGDQRDDLTTDPGRCVLLSTYALGGRGVDIPWIDTVLLATPRANVTQAMGRVMRELPGKKPAWVIDLVDQSSMLFALLAEKRQREYASRRVQVYGSGLDDFVAKL